MARGDDGLGLPLDEPERHPDGRVIIRLTRRRVEVVDAAIAALSEQEIFQRGGGLMDIVRDPENGEGGVVLPTGEPRVRITPYARVYELCMLAARFEAKKSDPEKAIKLDQERAYSWQEVDPPGPVVKTLIERGEWSHIRPLDAMVSWPVLRPDGSIFDGAGYDARTRCYSTTNTSIDLPPCITPDHVARAIALIDDVLSDFPFEQPAHKSSWYAALLSVLARPAVKGPVPMVIFDANDRGSGKTLLCDIIGGILTGQRVPRRGVPEKGSEDEWGKLMLGIGIGSYPVVLFDNVTGTLRSATLDMVLTGETYQGRVLGLNKEMKVPIRTQFLVSCNNAMISSDLVRRSLHARLVCEEERPEMREGFKYNLPGDVCEPAFRKRLLEAAFTILIGYEQAGRPKVKKRPIGSYEAWADRIQSAIIWAGLPDPVETQDELRQQASSEDDVRGQFLEAWFDMFGDRHITLRDALQRAHDETDKTSYGVENPKAKALLDVVAQLGDGKRVTAGSLSYKVRSWNGKVQNGLSICPGPSHSGAAAWFIKVSPTRLR